MKRNLMLLGTLMFMSLLSQAQTQPDTLKYCVMDHSVGVGGYDPVSYFTSDSPIEGKESINTSYDGVTYLFSSENNKQSFLKDPKKYLPQFGGWCSMTLAMGRATQPVYSNYLIKGDKLYLFERTLSINGQTVWRKDPQTHEKRAVGNYNQYKTNGVIK